MEIAKQVTGVDVSPEMLAQAEARDGVEYVVAPAEELPFEDESYDLVTVGLAFHWFDRERFLPEAHRVLRPDGWRSAPCREVRA